MAKRRIMDAKCTVIIFVFSCLIGTLRANKDISYSIDSVSLKDASVISLEERHRRQSGDAPAQGDTTTAPNLLDYNIMHDDHTYYRSTMLLREMADSYWVELLDQVGHTTLSDSHRTAVTAKLPFQFPFYGHTVTNITIATGGFLYMSPFLHQWLTATQYIAPLMANFDLSVGNNSEILIKPFDQKFVVEWRDVHLQDQNDTGTFRFQVILHYNGSIIFVYKKMPIRPSQISDRNHKVAFGLSDAFYYDTEYVDDDGQSKKRRTIYEYHRVVLNTTEIQEGTVVILHPKPTCNSFNDCESCVTASIGFTCKWCGIIQRCSDSVDWHRQEWLKAGCVHLATDSVTDCIVMEPNTTTTPTTTIAMETEVTGALNSTSASPFTTGSTRSVKTEPTSVATSATVKTDTTYMPTNATLDYHPCFDRSGSANCSMIPTKHPEKQTDTTSDTLHFVDDHSNMPNDGVGTKVAVIVIVIVLVVILVGSIAGWIYYAYTHPTSASGMWLMEHRPSQMKAKMANMKFWKSNGAAGDKYAVESSA
ncbi:plexin domain-containing protein 2-like isoform X2 [Mya arenaria]|uniref:plexin domain-containing protein 2-like isoform X2 n=1 Tax=Mya arenaria TaxID=6604 RepID=UPI0022E7DD36|nr:plexin domain-containing protein 2-like isoform X2 [Mya arenaria]